MKVYRRKGKHKPRLIYTYKDCKPTYTLYGHWDRCVTSFTYWLRNDSVFARIWNKLSVDDDKETYEHF